MAVLEIQLKEHAEKKGFNFLRCPARFSAIIAFLRSSLHI
jgi:hypothetical protein